MPYLLTMKNGTKLCEGVQRRFLRRLSGQLLCLPTLQKLAAALLPYRLQASEGLFPLLGDVKLLTEGHIFVHAAPCERFGVSLVVAACVLMGGAASALMQRRIGPD